MAFITKSKEPTSPASSFFALFFFFFLFFFSVSFAENTLSISFIAASVSSSSSSSSSSFVFFLFLLSNGGGVAVVFVVVVVVIVVVVVGVLWRYRDLSDRACAVFFLLSSSTISRNIFRFFSVLICSCFHRSYRTVTNKRDEHMPKPHALDPICTFCCKYCCTLQLRRTNKAYFSRCRL